MVAESTRAPSRSGRLLSALSRRARKVAFYLRMTRYRRRLQVPPPTHLEIEPTTRCNATCGTCSRGSLHPSQLKNDLTVDALERILAHFPEVRTMRLLGLGEPFLAPDIAPILETLHARGIKLWLISNGSLLRRPAVRELVHDHVYDLGVSIDSADPDEFARLRPMGAVGLAEVLEGTRQLLAERDAGRSSALIGINSAVSHENLDAVDAIGDLCIDLGVDYVSVAAVENWLIEGDPGHPEAADFVAKSMAAAPEITRRVARLRRRLLRHGIVLGYKTPYPRLGNCHWPFSSVHVDPTGNVTPCCIRTRAETHAVFNLFDDDRTFAEFWNGPEYQALRQAHLDGDTSNPICGSCPG